MLTPTRLFFALTLVASLGLASLASAADGVIYVDDLKSFDRALQETPSMRAGRPPSRSQGQLQGRPGVPTTSRPEMKKESFFSKLTPSWMRGEKQEVARPQMSASRTPSRFDEAVKQAAHVAQRNSARPTQAARPTQKKSTTPRSGSIAMRRDTQPRAGLLDGLMGTSAPKATPRPRRQPTTVASQQPIRTRPSLYQPAAPTASTKRVTRPMPRTPLVSKQPARQRDLPKVMATPAVMAMTGPPRTPLAASPKPSETVQPTTTKDEVVAIPSKPLPFNDEGLVFVTDADAEKTKMAEKIKMTETKLPVVTTPVAKLSETPSPQVLAEGPRLLAAQPVQETVSPKTVPQSVPQKLVATPYPKAERKASQNDQQPSERARALLAEAHALAAEAVVEKEFSAIIQRCRYVLAIDESTQAMAYANQLASWSLNKRGEGFADKGRQGEAESDFLEALRCNNACWRAEHNLAVIEAQRENYEAACQRFSRTIELNPEYAKAYCNRAALSVQTSDFSAAMRDYGRAIEANPDLAVAHIGRGRVCHMLGHLDQALRHLDAAELLLPRDASIVIGRGDLLVDLGRYGHAKAAYERAITLDPSSPTAYRNLAWMQATCPMGEFRDGEAALVNATKGADLAGEEDDIALDTRAAALAATGQFVEAAELQKQAIEIAPESDAQVYRERLAMYERGEVFTSQPIGGVQQTTYTK